MNHHPKDKDKEKDNDDNKDEEKSENDISEITDQAIFQGTFNLLNKNPSPKPNTPSSNSNSHPSQQSPQKEDFTKCKILQNLSKNDQPSTIPASNSMYSSGILSFRNKKTNFQMPQYNPNNQNKIEENMDPEAVTQSILEKINTLKKPKENLPTYAYEQRVIGKMYNNNDSMKFYEEEYDPKDVKAHNDYYDSEGNDNNNNNNSGDANGNDEENSNRVFWHITKDKDNNEDELGNKTKQNYFNQTASERKERKHSHKHKFLNRIVCTLSQLEKGKAIFVSQDDMIFVLPALFVPKNLNVGNTYVFKVREYEPYSAKSYNIQEIQKRYV